MEAETLVAVKVSHSNGAVDYFEIGTPCFDEEDNPCTLERALEILFDSSEFVKGTYTYTIG